MKKRLCLTFIALMIFLLTLIGASYADDSSINNETNANLSQGIVYNQKDNTTIGTLGNYPFGEFTSGPNVPPTQFKKTTANAVIFSNLPSKITRSIIKNYRGGLVSEKGKDFPEEMMEKIQSKPVIFRKFSKTSKIIPFPLIPKGLEEGKDYTKVAVWQFSAEDKIPSKWDFAMLLCQRGMDLGADLIIPIGENADYVFQNSSGAVSIFGAIAQIFASTPWGFNVSPGGGISSGKGKIQTLPSMTVAFVRILDKERFWTAANMEFAPKKAVKEIAKIKKTEISSKPKLNKELEKAKKKIKEQNEKLLACPFASPANAALRNEQGRNYLVLFVVSKDRNEQNEALDLATLNFSQALRDNPPAKIKKDIYVSLATVSFEKSKRVPKKKREYLKKTLRLSKMAGIKTVPTPEVWVKSWEEK